MLMNSIFGEDLFDEFFADPFFDDKALRKVDHKLYGHNARNLMKTDVRETEDGYDLEMDLPGFKKDEITVGLENGILTIRAAKGLDQEEQEKKTGRFIRRERYAGICERSFYVGDVLTEEDIQGQFHHGVLTLHIPRKDAKALPERKKYIAIEG